MSTVGLGDINRKAYPALSTRPGRGHKPILNPAEDKAAIPEAIKASRQRMRTAKAEWEVKRGEIVSDSTFRFFLKPGGRYKRIRHRPKGQPLAEHCTLQVEKPGELEQMSEKGEVDLYYGDETHVCSEGYVPYGWQFPDEEVCISSEKAYKLNCPGFIGRQNSCMWKTAEGNVDAQFVMEYLEEFSFQISRKTFVVLDNARVHKAKVIQERIPYWKKRGLYIFFLPPYSPHLNIAETMWRKWKKEWLNPEDYLYRDNLFYAVNRWIANLGHSVIIRFSKFNIN